MIGFNKPYLSGRELEYITQSVASEKISGDGLFTGKCHDFFCQRYGLKKVLLTTSCTDALEMAALLCNIRPGDEVIAPTFTFVSTVNAFVLRGAKIVFVDSRPDQPCLDASQIKSCITTRTRAVVVVHYGGVAVDMDSVMGIAREHDLLVVEDAAQAIDSFYKQRPLGSIGHLAAFSFHETKNIISGEGGMLVVNDAQFEKRAEIIREKGTNRSAFFRGEVDKYRWVDIGSSFLPSDIIAAFLFAQLENLDDIQSKRREIWARYDRGLRSVLTEHGVSAPVIPAYATHNAHLYYLVCQSARQRSALIEFLRANGIQAVFHYQPLHKSPYMQQCTVAREANHPNADRYADCLVRLPLYYELTAGQVDFIIEKVKRFFFDSAS